MAKKNKKSKTVAGRHYENC